MTFDQSVLVRPCNVARPRLRARCRPFCELTVDPEGTFKLRGKNFVYIGFLTELLSEVSDVSLSLLSVQLIPVSVFKLELD